MKLTSIKPAVIVAYYGGADVLEDIASRGYEPVRIQLESHEKTNQFLIQFFKKKHNYQSDVVIEKKGQSVAELAAVLKEIGVTHIIPADEAGVKLTDLLSEELNLPFNGIRLSKARRDKSLMHAQVASKGIRVPFQTTATCFQEVEPWMKETKLEFPIVIKPLDGAGSAGVCKCTDINQVKTAFECIKQLAIQKKTVVSVGNKVIVQEFLQGTEYVVDTVSLNGVHKLIDIFACKKGTHNQGSFVYEYFDLIDHESEVKNKLYSYACGVLDALDIKTGPGHLEIYMQQDLTPVLVEIGSRLGGPRMPYATSPCVASKKAQTQYAIDAYLEPDKFSDAWDDGYEKIKHSRMVFLIHYEEAVFKGFQEAIIKKIRELNSYYHAEFSVDINDRLKKTIDVRSSPGFIYLIHENPDQIELDYQEIRQLESYLYKKAILVAE